MESETMTIRQPQTDQCCPTCGCNAFRAMYQRQWFGSTLECRVCDHCGRTWNAKVQSEEQKAAQGQVIERPRCPMCRSTRTLATSTHGNKQYRKCQACGNNFKVLYI